MEKKCKENCRELLSQYHTDVTRIFCKKYAVCLTDFVPVTNQGQHPERYAACLLNEALKEDYRLEAVYRTLLKLNSTMEDLYTVVKSLCRKKEKKNAK